MNPDPLAEAKREAERIRAATLAATPTPSAPPPAPKRNARLPHPSPPFAKPLPPSKTNHRPPDPMKTTTTDTAARAAIDSAAAALGWTVTTPPKLYKDDPEPDPLPVYVTDPATGRALFVRRVTYPHSQAGRLSISPRWPESGTGRSYTPRTMPAAATLAGDTAPAAIARRLARYMEETADAYAEAVAQRDSYEAHARAQAATIAALVAGGWREPSRHAQASPGGPELAGNAYLTAAHVTGDRVQFELRNLSPGQALAVSRILAAGPPMDPLAPVRAALADPQAEANGRLREAIADLII